MKIFLLVLFLCVCVCVCVCVVLISAEKLRNNNNFFHEQLNVLFASRLGQLPLTARALNNIFRALSLVFFPVALGMPAVRVFIPREI